MNGDALRFFDGKPEELALYEALEARIFSEVGNVRLKVGKSQISFYNRHLFACVSFLRAKRKAELPAHYIVLTLGLDRPLDTPPGGGGHRALPEPLDPSLRPLLQRGDRR